MRTGLDTSSNKRDTSLDSCWPLEFNFAWENMFWAMMFNLSRTYHPHFAIWTSWIFHHVGVALYLPMWGEFVGSPQNSIFPMGIDLPLWGPNILGSRVVGIELTCHCGDWKPPEIPCRNWLADVRIQECWIPTSAGHMTWVPLYRTLNVI